MASTSRARHPIGSPARLTRGPRGVALIEFALILPLLLVLSLCVVDVSRAFWVKNVAYQAAREGVRFLVVNSLADTTDVRARVLEVVESAGVTLADLDYVDAPSGGLMEVHVGVSFDWLYPGLFSWLGADYTNPVTLESSSAMRRES
jgi:Flp pilus assembly protein TadG